MEGSKISPLESHALDGETVAITGRLATMGRAEAADLVAHSGGRFSAKLTRETTLLVVGQDGWPLAGDGRLTLKLRQARRLQQAGARLTIVEEEQFLARLGLTATDSLHRLYSAAELSRILRVPGASIKRWVEQGLIHPAETRQGTLWFDFDQVAGARTLWELSRNGAAPARIRRSLRQWARLVGESRAPLSALLLIERRGRLVWRNSRDQLVALDGQLHFDFGDEQNSELLPVAACAPRQESVETWFERGCAAEEEGRLADAEQAYRRALVQGGPDAITCFNLANVLRAGGRPGQAAERYWQAVELDPDFAEAWNNLGIVLGELKDLDGAREAFEAALNVAPHLADAHFNLADLLEQMGLRREARRHWQSYAAWDSTSPWGRFAQRRLAEE